MGRPKDVNARRVKCRSCEIPGIEVGRARRRKGPCSLCPAHSVTPEEARGLGPEAARAFGLEIRPALTALVSPVSWYSMRSQTPLVRKPVPSV